MKTHQILSRSAFRGATSQAVVLVCLVLIAALVTNIWLMISWDYKENFALTHSALNAEHVVCMISEPPDAVEEALDAILEDVPTTQREFTPGLLVPVTFPYGGNDMTHTFFVMEEETATSKDVGRVEILSESSTEEGLYFPLLYEDDLVTGLQTELTVGSEEKPWTIAGFFNSAMAGSSNCSIIELLATKTSFEELHEERIGLPGTLCSIRLANPEESAKVRSQLAGELTARFPSAIVVGEEYMRVAQSRYIASFITGAVFSAAAVLVLFLALVVAASNTANQIQRAMSDFGVLKAVGYTGRALVHSVLWQYGVLALPAAIAGSALSYTLYPTIVTSMVKQTGIPYEVQFLSGPFVTTVGICVIVIVLSAWLAARRIRDIDPIAALRSGIPTHSFQKNPLPLATSHGSANLSLGLKSAFSISGRTMIACISMGLLALLIVFCAVLVENTILHPEPVLDLVGVERADMAVEMDAQDEELVRQTLLAHPGVQDVYLYTTVEVDEPGGPGLTGIVIDDAEKLSGKNLIFKGRMPEYANEIALGAKHAEELGLAVNDQITLGVPGSEVTYLITGLSQSSNFLGDDAWFIREGYERIGDPPVITLYVRLEPGYSSQDVLDYLDAKTGDAVSKSVNVKEMIDSFYSAYLSALRLIVVVLAVLCVLMTALVMFLLVRMTVQSRLPEYGLLKALGYRSRDLVLQTIIGFMPAIAVSETLGLVLWSFAINPLLALFLSGIGTRACNFTIPVLMIAGGGLALFVLAIALVALVARRIGKADPVQLLTEE